METKKSRHVGRKIFYSLVMALSGLIVLLCIGSIVGGWALESRAEKAALAGLKFVENTAGVARGAIGKIEQPLKSLSATTTEITDASAKVSQNVTDKGLVMTLLPEEKEQELMTKADSVGNTLSDVGDTIGNVLDMYRTIDRLPFINLPNLTSDQMNKIVEGVAKTRALADSLRSDVSDARSGVAGKIDQVTILGGILNDTIAEVSDRLAKTDNKLAALQALAVRLQQIIPTLFLVIGVIVSLLLVFVLYTQVELLRLYVIRWKRLGEGKQAQSAQVKETPAA